MNRLLKIAEIVAGADARHRVFDPLVADWQRDMQHAHGSMTRAGAAISGSFAFARALAVCAVIDGVWIPPMRATLVALAAIAAAIGISIGVLLIAPLPVNSSIIMPRHLSEPMVQRWVLVWADILVPPVFLLATFLLRRDGRATYRHAIVITLLAAAAMTAIVVNTTEDALRRRYDTFEVAERMHELALASYRAGNFVYSGNRYQQALHSTVAERRANFERYRAQMARISTLRSDPPPTWRARFTQFGPVMLAVIFAVIGWTLAGFGHVTVPRAFGWWALVFAATITTTRILWMVVRVPMPATPQWVMPALFTAIACALAINALRSRHFTS